MVFYFTGTGNSLYVAKQLAEHPVSIPQAMKQDILDFTDARIGIVSPIYGHEMPQMVKDFLKKATFHTDYFYILLTYGNRHGGAAELARQYCDACGVKVNYINVIQMVDNWLPSFDMNEQKALDKHIPQQLAPILEYPFPTWSCIADRLWKQCPANGIPSGKPHSFYCKHCDDGEN